MKDKQKKYAELREAIMSDPSVHHWVKALIPQLETRDLCDVLSNLELLTTLFDRRLAELTPRG